MTVAIVSAVIFGILWSVGAYKPALVVFAICIASFGLKVLP